MRRRIIGKTIKWKSKDNNTVEIKIILIIVYCRDLKNLDSNFR